MIDHSVGVHIGKGLVGQADALFFLINSGGQGLFDDPALGAPQVFDQLIDLIGQLQWDVNRKDSGFGWASHDGVSFSTDGCIIC